MKEDGRKYKWYLAELLMYPLITYKKTKQVLNKTYILNWNNMRLVKARNAEEAYRKANMFGKECEDIYMNTDGNRVSWKFAGVRELLEIYDKFDDGSEIAYSEGYAKNLKYLLNKIPPKEKLGVFELKIRQEKEKQKEKTKNKKIKNKRKKFKNYQS
jgi:hypothetical protein